MNEATYELIQDLYEAKAAEEAAKAKRIKIESELAQVIGVPDQWEGTRTNDVGEFKVVVKRAMNIKIDAVRLREIAAQNNIGEIVMSTAFRWKPELNKKGWDNIGDEIKAMLFAAITKTPGKVGISVEIKKQEEK